VSDEPTSTSPGTLIPTSAPGADGDDSSIDVVDRADERPKRAKRTIDRGLLLASLVIAAGLALIVFGFTTALTGDDGIDRPDAIEAVRPNEGAVQVLQQDRIVVDLEAGYEARLIVNGVDVPTARIGETDVDPSQAAEPGQQVDLPTTAVFDPGNATISFQPIEGAVIESFVQGTNDVTVVYWLIEEGPEQARLYSWEFEVI
jgi:hypothetical protein